MIKDYYKNVSEQLEHIIKQEDLFIQAGLLLEKNRALGGKIYTFGTGHSHMIGQELYARAGGYADLHPICEIEFTTLTHPFKSTMVERTTDYLEVIKALYTMKEHDTVIVVSNSGRNPLVIEFCLWVKQQGASIIAITSMSHSTTVTSRHTSGLRLFEVADLVFDNGSVCGDATLQHTNTVVSGPTSTITSAFIANAIISTFVQLIVEKEGTADVFRSSNVDHADEYNQKLFKKYL